MSLGRVDKGTGHFIGQRLSAIALLVLGLWFAWSLLVMPGFSHSDAVAFIGVPLNSIMLSLLVVSMAYHSKVGIQVVIEDYVHGDGLNRASLLTSLIAHSLVAVAAVYSIIKIGFAA